MSFPQRTRSSAILALFLLAALASGCAGGRTAPRVTQLGDGLLKSPTAQDAEAYCRNFGAPLRFVTPEVKGSAMPIGEVTYRCD